LRRKKTNDELSPKKKKRRSGSGIRITSGRRGAALGLSERKIRAVRLPWKINRPFHRGEEKGPQTNPKKKGKEKRGRGLSASYRLEREKGKKVKGEMRYYRVGEGDRPVSLSGGKEGRRRICPDLMDAHPNEGGEGEEDCDFLLVSKRSVPSTTD